MSNERINNLNELPEDVKKVTSLAGIIPTEEGRSGSFFQQDQSILCARSAQKGVEVFDTETAMKQYPWVKDYYWKAVDPEKDEFTKMVKAESALRGYFIRTLPGVETIYPLQACLFIGSEGMAQKVHNIIIAEEGSRLHIITGCTVNTHVKSGMHIGISEFYVKKNASITFTMVHNWAEGIDVRPRSVAHVEEGGTFINNYICMKPVKTLQLYPAVYLLGKGARSVAGSVVLGKGRSLIDIGFRVFLKAEDTSAESVPGRWRGTNQRFMPEGI